MQKLGLLALVPLLLAVGCRTGVSMWDSCSVPPGADSTGTDGTYVLVCKDGRWEPIMTNDEFVAMAQQRPVTIAPLPVAPIAPTPTTPVEPPLTTVPATTTTTTIAPAPREFSAISLSIFHACGIVEGGAACWGYNYNGRLGDGTTTDHYAPVDVVGMSSGIVSVAAGGGHSCAVTSAGAVWCWGSNSYGQLGTGDFVESATPVAVPQLSSGVVAVSAGSSHSCALTSTGEVMCWGRNANGQLGDGTTSTAPTPVAVTGLSDVVTLQTGGNSNCVATSGGAAKCWGENNNGQLGDNTDSDRSVPVAVSGLGSGVTQISTGMSNSCAVVDGGAKCWGENSFGQLGDGTIVAKRTPVDVQGMTSGVSSIAASGYYSICATSTAGAATCWGFNTRGQGGNGTETNTNTPTGVSGLSSGVASISTGGFAVCAVTTSGAGKCWGEGPLGDGTYGRSALPVDVTA